MHFTFGKQGEKHVEKSKQGFDEVTDLLRKELSRFEKEKIEDFHRGMVKFVESVIESQKKQIALWEDFSKTI